MPLLNTELHHLPLLPHFNFNSKPTPLFSYLKSHQRPLLSFPSLSHKPLLYPAFLRSSSARHFVEDLVGNGETSEIEENVSGFGSEKFVDSTEQRKLQFNPPTAELKEASSAGHFVEHLVGNCEKSEIEDNVSGFGSEKFADSTEQRKLQFNPPTAELKGCSSAGNFVEHLVGNGETDEIEENVSGFDSEKYFDSTELKKLQFNTPLLEVKELEELPENWRRSRIAWLCKELPSHKKPTLTRLLNAQKKWIRQDDATYIAVHCMRIRENEAGFWVYKWMIQQHWFKFDFALATKLADYMGRERKFSRCREIFDDIIKQGRVPSESTFHILIVAYLSAPGEDFIEEACEIYNQMINLGGYQPRLSLHNALFRAIISKPGVFAKQYLKQAEFIFHNLVTCGLEIHKDIFRGLIWLYSYQDIINKDRMSSLRNEMHLNGIDESSDVLLSVLRACSKEGDLEEAEKIWFKLLHGGVDVPSIAYIYKMEVHAKVGDYAESLKVFREMQGRVGSINVGAYHKIIEIMCDAREVEHVESLMEEFIGSGLMPLTPSYVDLLNLYFKLGLYDKVEATFYECLKKCHPNRTIYSIYLDSLVQTGNVDEAENIFHQMLENDAIGVNSRSCNIILSAYLHNGDHAKAGKIFRFMGQKKFDINSSLTEKLKLALSSAKEVVGKPMVLKLTPEQREILVGLLLGGLRVECAENKKHHFINFEFKDNSDTHFILKRHIYYKYHEWLQPSSNSTDDIDHIPWKFSTVPHICFGFYGDQFWPNGKPMIPKLLHRWLSPCVLAYWYMYGGYRTSNGDILLKVKGSKSDVERFLKALKHKGLDFKVKQKGNLFWLGFPGSYSSSFWRLVEPHILASLKDILKPQGLNLKNGTGENWSAGFGSESDREDDEDQESDLSYRNAPQDSC